MLLTAGIWGFGFVAQRSGMEYVGPFAYNGIRFVLGSVSLLPLIIIRRSRKLFHSSGTIAETELAKTEPHRIVPSEKNPIGLLQSSLAAGACLFAGVILQQFGLLFTTAGNAGFITGLYVVLTPIFGLLLGKKTGRGTWLGAAFALAGLYFISAADGFSSINPGDIIVMASAVFWTAHVLLIDRLMQGPARSKAKYKNTDPIELSAGQFAVCAFLCLICAPLIEPHIGDFFAGIDPGMVESGLFSWKPFPELVSSIRSGAVSFAAGALIPILYGGIGSVGIAYTLQVVAQSDAPPAHAAIILCFEGFFAALGGVLLLSEKVNGAVLLGFILMLAGMLVTQWEVIGGRKKKGNE